MAGSKDDLPPQLCSPEPIGFLLGEVTRLRKELAEAKLDAERWRFYCEHGSDDIDRMRLHAWIEAHKFRLGGREAAIDEVMRRFGSGEPADD